jgi:RNA 2',3'-cyclic 3'-phosphodiesterase
LKEEKLKLFVAVPVHTGLKNDLNKFIEENSDIANIRWIPEENWHITLFFIGFINSNKLNFINEKISKVISNRQAFPIEFEKYSMEGKPSKSSMIWCRFHFSKIFVDISAEIGMAINNELEQVQNFKRSIPHITLARLRNSVNRKEINLNIKTENRKLHINYCQLWQSIGTTSGMIYRSLFEYSFLK